MAPPAIAPRFEEATACFSGLSVGVWVAEVCGTSLSPGEADVDLAGAVMEVAALEVDVQLVVVEDLTLLDEDVVLGETPMVVMADGVPVDCQLRR